MGQNTDFVREATVELQQADLVTAQRLQLWAGLRLNFWKLAFLWLVGLGCLMILQWDTSRNRALDAAITGIGLAIVIIAVPTVLVYLLGPSGARKTLRIQKSLHGPYTAVWTPEDISLSNEQGSARLKWTNFHRVAQNDEMFLFFESDRLCRMLPKRVLSGDQIADINAILARAGKAA